MHNFFKDEISKMLVASKLNNAINFYYYSSNHV